MADLILTCANCGNEFVFTTGEQIFYAQKKIEAPRLCPICRSMKAQENKIPPKPPKPSPQG
jgi:hypothetical protein